VIDARTQAWLDQEDARVAAMIRRYGWAIEYVGGGSCSAPGCDGGHSDGPAFAYTVGLFGLNHPELLIFGVPPGTAAGVLNTLGERIRSGEALLPGRIIAFEEWPHRIIPEHVPNPGEIVFSANRYYQRPPQASVPVLQLSYDDTAGRFPWETGYAAPALQPRPGTFHA
jgi:hypothetical protein